MADYITIRKKFEAILAKVGGVDSFTTDQAKLVMKNFIDVISQLRLNGNGAENFLFGYSEIFKLDFIGSPNLKSGKYIFTPNHVSEFDGPLFGLLHPNMLVMAKKEWTDDLTLFEFLSQFFKVVGVDRNDKLSGVMGIKRCIQHIKNFENSAVTIFVQQTIADININQPEDIASGAFFVHKKTGADIIPVFCEQVSFHYPTRIVFGNPLEVTHIEQFGQEWLKAELQMQHSLINPQARKPILNEKHSTPISQRDF